MSYYNFNTGLGSRHTVSFPDPEWWLDAYTVEFSWDDSRNAFMALVSLANYPKEGGYSTECIIIYFMPSDDKEAGYQALAEALKLSSNPWKIRKLWYSKKNRKLRNKLKGYGWHDQAR